PLSLRPSCSKASFAFFEQNSPSKSKGSINNILTPRQKQRSARPRLVLHFSFCLWNYFSKRPFLSPRMALSDRSYIPESYHTPNVCPAADPRADRYVCPAVRSA